MATQSSGDTEPPSALATLYLEDGTKLTGQSFGSHESIEGEVSRFKFYGTYHFTSHNLADVFPVRISRLFSPPVWLVIPNL